MCMKERERWGGRERPSPVMCMASFIPAFPCGLVLWAKKCWEKIWLPLFSLFPVLWHPLASFHVTAKDMPSHPLSCGTGVNAWGILSILPHHQSGNSWGSCTGLVERERTGPSGPQSCVSSLGTSGNVWIYFGYTGGKATTGGRVLLASSG